MSECTIIPAAFISPLRILIWLVVACTAFALGGFLRILMEPLVQRYYTWRAVRAARRGHPRGWR